MRGQHGERGEGEMKIKADGMKRWRNSCACCSSFTSLLALFSHPLPFKRTVTQLASI